MAVSAFLQLSLTAAAAFSFSFASSHLFLLHFLPPHTDYYTPFSVLLHLFPSPVAATVTAFSLAPAFPRLSHSFLLTQLQPSQVLPFLALPCLSPSAAVAVPEQRAQPQSILNLLTLLQICPLHKSSKSVAVSKPYVTLPCTFISHQAYL